MKIAILNNQLFDDKGAPLSAGRVSVYLHGSDTLASVYTLEGDEYAEAENPLLCSEDGRLPTLFADAAVYDIKVEKDNGDGTYELLDTFESGFDWSIAGSDSAVSGIDALKNTNVDLGVVTVTGYDEYCQAPTRTYVWDSTCSATADGGVVIESDTGATGRWILLWDDEILPCTVYGIVPGHEANISAFLNFQDNIGQWQIRTPKICRFVTGTYSSNTTFTTQKGIYLDKGVQFTWANMTCPYVIAQPTSTWIFGGSWYFNNNNAVGYLSWFRYRSHFVACGAPIIFVDKDNTSGAQQVTLQGKEVHFFITPPSWLMINDCIQYVPSAGMIKPARAWVDKLFSVGRNFEIIPHDDVMNPYYEFSVAGDSYPTMRLSDDQCVLFHNGITVHEGFDIPGRTVNGTYYPQQWWGYFDDGEDGPVVQIKAKGDVEVTNLKGNLTSTTSNIGTLNVTSEAKVSKLMGRNYDFIPLFSGLVRSYSEVDLNWTSYGSHILPATVPADALIKIHMTWAWSDSSSVPISDYIHLSGASGRSFGDVIALENCGPQSASFTFEDMYRDGDAKKIASKCGPIYVIDMNLNLIDIIPAFERHTFMYNGSGWERVSV